VTEQIFEKFLMCFTHSLPYGEENTKTEEEVKNWLNHIYLFTQN
jgi:hypothetical protein